MLMSLDIAILPSPLTLPLPLSPNVILSTPLLSFVLIELNILKSPACVVCTHYQVSNAFLQLCNWCTKEDQFFLGTQTCLGPWRLVTKLFRTQMAFFFEAIHGVPMNLAFTQFVPVYTKIWEEERRKSKLLRLYHQGIDCIRIDISWFRCGTGIGSLRMMSADNDNELRLASGNTCRTLQKGKD